MTSIFGLDYNDELLIPLGKVVRSDNHVVLRWADGALARLGAQLRPFVLLAPGRTSHWPALLFKMAEDNDVGAVVWASPKGKSLDHRPKVLTGKMLDSTLAVLWPTVPVAKLAELDPRMDGFLTRTR